MTVKSALPNVLGLALLCLAISAGADNNDAFEDCATTTFEMRNNKVYLGADVIKFVKLTTGQGSTDCMSLCRASDECWSYNYDKTRKFCYLSSNEGSYLKSKRRQTWNSGYRVCVAHSDNTEWNNEEVDASTLAPTWETIDVQYTNFLGIEKRKLQTHSGGYPWSDGTITFTWKAAKGLKGLNGAALPQYRIRCGPNNTDWHCDEATTEGWNSGFGLIDETYWSTSATEDFQALFALGVMKCYVEIYVDGIKTACSDAQTDIIDPFAAPMEWQPPTHQAIEFNLDRRRLQTHSTDNNIVVNIYNSLSSQRDYTYFYICTDDFSITRSSDLLDEFYSDSKCYTYIGDGYPSDFSINVDDYYNNYGCRISAYSTDPLEDTSLGPPARSYSFLHNIWFNPKSGQHRCFLYVYAAFYGNYDYGFEIGEPGNGTIVSVSGNSSTTLWTSPGSYKIPQKVPSIPHRRP